MSTSWGMIAATGAYALAKLAGYSWWCAVGLVRMQPTLDTRDIRRQALRLGMIRLGLGIVLGAPMALVFGFVVSIFWFLPPLGYVLTYAPVRWFEWGIMTRWIAPQQASMRQLLRGPDPVERRWRVQGILLSCALDLLLLLMAAVGISHMGRIFC